ncbi:MAG: hypothetical protein Q9162_000845 [Coniocarpon cinnabarinum]
MSEKPPQDDRRSWDDESLEDPWITARRYQPSWDTPTKRNMWAASPTPAEAAAAGSPRKGDRKLEKANGCRAPSRGHHDPRSAWGHQINKERIQRHRENEVMSPWRGHRGLAIDRNRVIDSSSAPESPQAMAETDSEPEEDLIDLASKAHSDSDSEENGNDSTENHRRVNISYEGTMFDEPGKGCRRDTGSDESSSTTSGSGSQTVQAPAQTTNEVRTQTSGASHSRSKLHAVAKDFKPRMASAELNTPNVAAIPFYPAAGPPSPHFTFQPTPFPQNEMGITPWDTTPPNTMTIPSHPFSSPFPSPARNPLPNPKSPCPATCGAFFPSKSLIFHHLESNACMFLRLSTRDIYAAVAETHCAHDFIDGRYLRDLTLKRDIREKYKGNAYPFICPNEERCGMVFRELYTLWVHFERSECGAAMGRVGVVKATVEDAVAEAVGTAV